MHAKLFTSRAYTRLQIYTTEQWHLIRSDARIQSLSFLREVEKVDGEIHNAFLMFLETLVRPTHVTPDLLCLIMTLAARNFLYG